MTRPTDAAAGRAGPPLFGAGALIAGAFWTLAWLAPRPGEPLFIAGLATAAGGYLAAVALLARKPAVSPLVLTVCLCLALAWRGPLLTLPEVSANDAVRYLQAGVTISAAGGEAGSITALIERVPFGQYSTTRRISCWGPAAAGADPGMRTSARRYASR